MIDASLTWRKRLLGHEFFKPRFGLGSRILFSIGGAVTLFWIGDQTRMFGSEYASTSLRGALYFFAWLIALSLIDIYRNKLWRLPVSGSQGSTSQPTHHRLVVGVVLGVNY